MNRKTAESEEASSEGKKQLTGCAPGCAYLLLFLSAILALMYGGIRAGISNARGDLNPMGLAFVEQMGGPWRMFVQFLKRLPEMPFGESVSFIVETVVLAPTGWWVGTVVVVLIGIGVIANLTDSDGQKSE